MKIWIYRGLFVPLQWEKPSLIAMAFAGGYNMLKKC